MARIITTITLLFISSIINSQTFSWLKTPPITLNLNADMVGYPTVCDPAGNIYITGFKENASPVSSDIMGTVFYNKYNEAGDLLFSKDFTGLATIYCMKSDDKGNILLAMGYDESVTIDDVTLTADGAFGQPILTLLKFNADGDLLWHYKPTLPDPEEWEYVSDFRSIATDGLNNIYIGYDNFNNSYITKLSPQGDVILTINQTGVNRITCVDVDTAGNIYATGSCAGNFANFNGHDAATDLTYNTYIVKYSVAGTYQWQRYMEDITCPEPQVAVNNPDEVYFSSYLFGNFMFDNIETEGPFTSFGDFFLAKLNSQGNYVWVREVPGDGEVELGRRNFLTLDNSGNIYMCGKTRWDTDWGNGITTNIEGVTSDALILKYNEAGTLLFAKTAGGPDSSDRTDGITVNNQGDVYISGMASDDAAFDDIVHQSQGFQFYPFLAKITAETLSTPQIHDSKTPVIYPNPSDSFLYITGIENDAIGIIYNMLGQKIKEVTINTGDGINISDISKGTYTISIKDYKPIKFIKY